MIEGTVIMVLTRPIDCLWLYAVFLAEISENHMNLPLINVLSYPVGSTSETMADMQPPNRLP